MIFQSLMNLGNSRCGIPSGPPKDTFALKVTMMLNVIGTMKPPTNCNSCS